MMSTETLTGHVKPDGTLELEHPSKLPAGRVEIILRSIPQTEPARCTAGDNWWEYLRRVRADLAADGGPFRSQEEIEGEREAFRDEDGPNGCNSSGEVRAV